MADVKVRTLDVEVRTVKLTKSLLKQFQIICHFSEARKYLPGGTENQDPAGESPIIGWVHGSVLEADDKWGRWLIIRVGPGDFRRWQCMEDTASKYDQIYIV